MILLLSTIEVNVRLDCIEILSFPGPLPPVDNTQLKKPRVISRDSRNRRIGDFLKELHLTEGRGTGIPKIRKAMTRNGSPEALFETDKDSTYFLTTLPIHKEFLGKQPKQKGTKKGISRGQVVDKSWTSRGQVMDKSWTSPILY